MSEDFKRFKQSVDAFEKAKREILTGCVEKQVNRKMQLVSLARWKFRNRPSDVFAFCIKPYARLWCQAPLDGKVFCMAETPCWKLKEKDRKC